jgi:hypothetical protein
MWVYIAAEGRKEGLHEQKKNINCFARLRFESCKQERKAEHALLKCVACVS